jgi:NAD-dependent deacetylase
MSNRVNLRELLIERAVELLRGANRVVVLTGAGISAESGLSTFRDKDGHWSAMDPEKLATRRGFEEEPVKVWNWYAERYRSMQAAEPNDAHRALVKIEDNVDEFLLVTQNIDGLHGRAGSRSVLEMHGSISLVTCIREDCGFRCSWTGHEDKPLQCTRCDSKMRPDVVWFGETIRGFDTAEFLSKNCDVFMCIGTSAQVAPAAYLPAYARAVGAKIITINPENGDALDPELNNIFIGEKAGVVLPKIVEEAWT